jgi:hypothetical protein
MSGGRRGKLGARAAGWVVGILALGALGAGEAPLPASNTPERRSDAPVAPPPPSVMILPLPDDPEMRSWSRRMPHPSPTANPSNRFDQQTFHRRGQSLDGRADHRDRFPLSRRR